MKVDLALFDRYISDKLITRQQHPDAPLLIFNYTPVCQFGRNWDEVTMMCRGLITDLEGNVVARPFKKFFNYGEYQGEVPQSHYIVTEKMDGSLGVLYLNPVDNEYALATRGSFESDQAKKGTEMLREILRRTGTDFIDPDCTYLFEIIYPQNRIVVDYGDTERLVLLDVLNTETSTSVFDERALHTPFELVASHGVSINHLLKEERPNHEGYVLYFPETELRLKVKHEEYVRLHRLLTQVSSKSIWEVLKNGDSLEEVLDRVPDEFYQWVRETERKLRAKHDEAIATAAAVYDAVDKTDRKAAALAIQGKDGTTKAIVFALLDGKTAAVEKIAWQYARPTYEKPFKQDIDA